MRALPQLLQHCQNNGLTMVCFYDDQDDPDYRGGRMSLAAEALGGCDEMNLLILDAEGKKWGWAFVVNEVDQDPEEQIADHSCDDRLDAWMKEGKAA